MLKFVVTNLANKRRFFLLVLAVLVKCTSRESQLQSDLLHVTTRVGKSRSLPERGPEVTAIAIKL